MSNDFIVKSFIFVIGGAVGSAITFKLTKDYCQRENELALAEMREYYKSEESTDDIPEEKNEEVSKEPEKAKSVLEEIEEARTRALEYNNIIKKEGYVDYSNPEVEDISEDTEKPYVIEPEEYGELPGYNIVELTYYSDKVLTDDNDDIIEDVEHTIGWESLDELGEYWDNDCIHVRNDARQCDYQIFNVQERYVDRFPDEED